MQIPPPDEGYDIGLVCENGHKVNSKATGITEMNAEYCQLCGARSIFACPHCERPIRGFYDGPGPQFLSWSVPNHCHACGKPYPWTKKKAEALREIIGELEGLNDEEREKLKRSVADLIADTPRSGAAALIFKKAATKVTDIGKDIFIKTLTTVATATVKNELGL